LLHLGCGLTAPPEWVNVDGSHNAWLSKHPVARALVRPFMSKASAEVEWPQNIISADLRQRLPFADRSFDAAYSSHFIEHLHRSEALALFRELKRVLVPGGVCRTLVPDLEAFIREYNEARATGSIADPADQLNRIMQLRYPDPPGGRWPARMYRSLSDFHSHKWMYDDIALIKLMTEAGFVDCRRAGFLETKIPHLDKVERAERFEGSVAVEGRTPEA
jgi:predicted SAM-dependent methyltransferase